MPSINSVGLICNAEFSDAISPRAVDFPSSNYLEEDVDIGVIQVPLGHSNIASTFRYLGIEVAEKTDI